MSVLAPLVCLTLSVVVPKMNAPVIDGRIGGAEWTAAQEVASGAGEVRIGRDAEYVYVSLKGASEAIGSIHVGTSNAVTVLHASAALGDVVYRRQGSHWSTSDKFVFACRDKSESAEAVSARNHFLKSHGWLASVSGMGNRGEREFKISLELLKGAGIVIGYYDPEAKKMLSQVPAQVADESLDEKLVCGWLPEKLRFEPGQWLKLEVVP